MSTINEMMSAVHRACDQQFADAEASVANADWENARREFDDFLTATEAHFEAEEQVLFPRFEATTGQSMGPTQVMRSEHQQMRQLFGEMRAAMVKKDKNAFLGFAETLMIIMQQHNMKEEQILYRMSDQVLGADAAEVLSQIFGGH